MTNHLIRANATTLGIIAAAPRPLLDAILELLNLPDPLAPMAIHTIDSSRLTRQDRRDLLAIRENIHTI